MKYQESVKRGREAARSQWTLGDLALDLEPKYGEATLERYAEDIGVEFKTLEDYRYVSSRFEFPVRTGNLAWSVYKIFAAQEDRLDLISQEREKPWTASAAREFVQARASDDQIDEDLEGKKIAVDEILKLYIESAAGYNDEERRTDFREELEELCESIMKMWDNVTSEQE